MKICASYCLYYVPDILAIGYFSFTVMMWEGLNPYQNSCWGNLHTLLYLCTERILFNQICSYSICTSLLCYVTRAGKSPGLIIV